MTRPPKTPTHAQLETVLRILKEYATHEWCTRNSLVRLSRLSDRTFRLCAEHLVRMGEPIATNHRQGYRYVEGSTEHLATAASELEAKARTMLRRARSLRETIARTVERNRGQADLPLDDAAAFG